MEVGRRGDRLEGEGRKERGGGGGEREREGGIPLSLGLPAARELRTWGEMGGGLRDGRRERMREPGQRWNFMSDIRRRGR